MMSEEAAAESAIEETAKDLAETHINGEENGSTTTSEVVASSNGDASEHVDKVSEEDETNEPQEEEKHGKFYI